MIKTPNQIVTSAYTYLKEIIPPTQKIGDPRLEELVPDETTKHWKVVISYDALGDFPFEKKREYKEFSVDDNTGSVLWMKIWKSTNTG